jgi:hypothetical protein
MPRRSLDPRRCNIALDSMVMDKKGNSRDALVDRFLQLLADGSINVVVGGGVRNEIEHANTPASVKRAVLPQPFNLRPGLNTQQGRERAKVHTIVQGNAKPGQHAADASHLSEAVETGCGYFITEDHRILNKRAELTAEIPPTLSIVSLLEFFDIYDRPN